MRKLFVLPTICFLLSGCAEYFASKEAFRSEARMVAAEVLETALWTQCRAATVGSIGDAYGLNDDTWIGYAAACRPYWRKYVIPAPVPAADGSPLSLMPD